ncbi:SDR family oxidoreductase [Pontibacterium sp. N1Y112]|uniref:SDR family oxidoreductase n=1 Tax=Pontibacterium sinense TaxID=2781979 RepID=A0A8J7FCB3_9GAMM|nr:SDR family oxidoreductase [Pontibacterium sinense]MBE9398372.1 SDR family oxidoreductase [Pontibacterium sinense]
MPTILITGANRGIGLALTKSYLKDGWRVLATTRSPGTTVAKGAEPLILDVTDPDSIAALKAQLCGIPIDVLWNNAGVYLDKNKPLGEIDDEDWVRTFEINTISPIRIAEALAENVAASDQKVMAFTTSKMGSLTHNGMGAYAYRSSKAALNMAVRCVEKDFSIRGISCLLLHPGHVRTDLGGSEGAIDVDTSVKGMRRVVDHVNTSNREDFSGGFFDYDGSTIPW